MRFRIEQPPEKEKIKQRLLKIKKESLEPENDSIEAIIIDLEWYLDLKKKQRVNPNTLISDLDLWNTMEKVYKDFNEEELQQLIDCLKGANN